MAAEEVKFLAYTIIQPAARKTIADISYADVDFGFENNSCGELSVSMSNSLIVVFVYDQTNNGNVHYSVCNTLRVQIRMNAQQMTMIKLVE